MVQNLEWALTRIDGALVLADRDPLIYDIYLAEMVTTTADLFRATVNAKEEDQLHGLDELRSLLTHPQTPLGQRRDAAGQIRRALEELLSSTPRFKLRGVAPNRLLQILGELGQGEPR